MSQDCLNALLHNQQNTWQMLQSGPAASYSE